MKIFRLFLVGFVVTQLGAFPLGLALGAYNQDILIFRPLENSRKMVSNPDFEFEVEISAFDPIISVTINGRPYTITSSTWVKVKGRYRLLKGENKFQVEAATKTEKAYKEFKVTLFDPTAQAKGTEEPAFRMVTIVGAEQLSNPLKDSTPTITSTRNFLIVVPRYDLAVSKGAAVRFLAIISRDRFGDESPALADEEIAFTQLKTSFVRKFGAGDYWDLGVGSNTIQQGFDSLTNLESDSLLFATMRRSFGKNNAYVIGLELKERSMADAVADPNDPDSVVVTGDDPVAGENGMVATLKTSLEMRWGKFLTKMRGEYADHDSVGTNKQKTVALLAMEGKYLLGSFQLGLGLRSRQSLFKEPGSIVGFPDLTPNETLISYMLESGYQITRSMLLTLGYKTDTQASNDATRVYDNSGAKAALIYVF